MRISPPPRQGEEDKDRQGRVPVGQAGLEQRGVDPLADKAQGAGGQVLNSLAGPGNQIFSGTGFDRYRGQVGPAEPACSR